MISHARKPLRRKQPPERLRGADAEGAERRRSREEASHRLVWELCRKERLGCITQNMRPKIAFATKAEDGISPEAASLRFMTQRALCGNSINSATQTREPQGRLRRGQADFRKPSKIRVNGRFTFRREEGEANGAPQAAPERLSPSWRPSMSLVRLPDAPSLPRVAEIEALEIWFLCGFAGFAALFWAALVTVRAYRRKRARDGVFRKYHLPGDEFS